MLNVSNGDCYLCGVNLGKTAMKSHLQKFHSDEENGMGICGYEGELDDFEFQPWKVKP